MVYPAPLFRAKEVLQTMAPGEILELLATDPGTGPDMPIWTEQEGYELLETSQDDEGQRFYIRKPAERSRPAAGGTH